MSDEEFIQVNVRIPKTELKKIDQKAKDAGLSRTAFIRLAASNIKINMKVVTDGSP